MEREGRSWYDGGRDTQRRWWMREAAKLAAFVEFVLGRSVM